MKKIHIIGGGTFSHVRNHLALAAPAFGETARALYGLLHRAVADEIQRDQAGDAAISSTFSRQINEQAAERVVLHLTKMAAPRQSNLVTNEDVSALLDKLIADPDTRVIILNAALCDYDGAVIENQIGEAFSFGDDAPYITESGKHAKRLKTSAGEQILQLTPANKLIGKIRKDRKDIFVVGFKTTTGAESDTQYRIALDMLKRDSLNLVLANDTVTRNNMIVAPEETRYCETTDREAVITTLAEMVIARSKNTFTRSTVVEGESVRWDSPLIPANLREVVDFCIEKGAYKPFRGATAGHFAVRVDDQTILTSKRKQNFNHLAEIGLVKVEYEGDDKVVAFGAKPSVGGQSQRIVFREHPELDCIVHFHCPLKPGVKGIGVASQWQNECGSHQCGANTSRNLANVPGVRNDIKAVMLDGHGPNIVFSRNTPAVDVIKFINDNFDLSQKTGGPVSTEYDWGKAVGSEVW
jgi:hypothetical protein